MGARIIDALTGSTYSLPRVEMRFNADNNAVPDKLYLVQIEQSNGEARRHYINTAPGGEDRPSCRMKR